MKKLNVKPSKTTIMKVIKFKTSNQKQVNKVTNLKPSKSKDEILKEFQIKLNEKMRLNKNDWDKYSFIKRLIVFHKNKIFRTKGVSYQMKIKNEDYRLSLIPNNSNSIEVWWIQVYKKGNGLGTDIMNNILDVSDELGIGVKVIPVDIDSEEFVKGNLYRLRGWYRSFGFKSRNFERTPELYYEPQREQILQVS